MSDLSCLRFNDAVGHLSQYGGGPSSATLIDALEALAGVNDALMNGIDPLLVNQDINAVITILNGLKKEVKKDAIKQEPT